MKKRMVFGILLSALLTACADTNTSASDRSAASNANSVESVLQQQIQAENLDTATAVPTVEIIVDNPVEDAGSATENTFSYELSGDPDPSVDIDLTVMNSTMVYAQVYDMMVQPDAYIGMSIKMRGLFSVYEADKQVYYSCIIQDATACCAQGIEFVPEDYEGFSDALPAQGEEITVRGVFDVYPEGDYLYAVLLDADFPGSD